MKQNEECIIRGTPPTTEQLAELLVRLLEDQRGTKITYTIHRPGDREDKTA